MHHATDPSVSYIRTATTIVKLAVVTFRVSAVLYVIICSSNFGAQIQTPAVKYHGTLGLRDVPVKPSATTKHKSPVVIRRCSFLAGSHFCCQHQVYALCCNIRCMLYQSSQDQRSKTVRMQKSYLRRYLSVFKPPVSGC